MGAHTHICGCDLLLFVHCPCVVLSCAQSQSMIIYLNTYLLVVLVLAVLADGVLVLLVFGHEVVHAWLVGWVGGWLVGVWCSPSSIDSLTCLCPQVLRLLKFVRFLRLPRMLRTMSKSEPLNALEDVFSVSYAVKALVGHLLRLLVLCHWLACVWCLTAEAQLQVRKPTVLACQLMSPWGGGKN